MTDIVTAVQVALKAAIDAGSLGVTVYDGAPADVTFPFIEFGSDDTTPNDADCINGQDVTVQINIWGRDGGNLLPTRALTGQVRDLVHEADLSLADPFAAVNSRVVLRRVFLAPDGLTAQGVLQVTVLAEDTT